jgi:hypothetical protein
LDNSYQTTDISHSIRSLSPPPRFRKSDGPFVRAGRRLLIPVPFVLL